MNTPAAILWLAAWLTPAVTEPPVTTPPVEDALTSLYTDLGPDTGLGLPAFTAAYRSAEDRGMRPTVLAIADMTRPSTEKRLHVIDLEARKVVLRTWVAHGRNTGELMAERFSNRHGSHQTSLGLYRVGAEIISPKHGPALLLHGLDRGVNCRAEAREVIMHGADYVSAAFIAEHGRLGRSWGCPAVAREEMPPLIGLLANGGLMYMHGHQ